MYDWFIPVLLASTLIVVLAAVFIQIAVDTFRRKKYDEEARPPRREKRNHAR